MQREIARVLLEKIRDPRVQGVTITGIRLTNDLKAAKVFYSVLGDDQAIGKAQSGLDSARGFIKREIGVRVALKYVPDIAFLHDPSLESGSYMEKLLESLKPHATSDDGE